MNIKFTPQCILKTKLTNYFNYIQWGWLPLFFSSELYSMSDEIVDNTHYATIVRLNIKSILCFRLDSNQSRKSRTRTGRLKKTESKYLELEY